MLESIPGEVIAKAAAMLPDAQSAPDEPHDVVIGHAGRRICITFRRLVYLGRFGALHAGPVLAVQDR
jgi:hypothetical protein